MKGEGLIVRGFIVLAALTLTSADLCAQLDYYGAEMIQAGGGEILVGSYSVPSYADWNADGRPDLIVGEKTADTLWGKVRVYLNTGTAAQPQFNNFSYAQSTAGDLKVTAAGCMGCFPRVVYWDPDARQDLLVGLTVGKVMIFLNTGTESDPCFDGGALIQVGPAGATQELDVGSRATPVCVDWDNDNKTDLLVGGYDGRIRFYRNSGTGQPPVFEYESFGGTPLQENGSDLIVPLKRSSPTVCDFNNDGKKDLLTGDSEGKLLLYENVGTDAAPAFSGYSLVESEGTQINLGGVSLWHRSRPFVCNLTDDGRLDLLVGSYDGKVRLYEGIIPGDMYYDRDVDLDDFAAFGNYFQQTNCGKCGGADLTGDGNVDLADLHRFAAHFLNRLE